MTFWVAVTDNAWFRFLARRDSGEALFWHPGGRPIANPAAGTPFLFHLKRPAMRVAGGGTLVTSLQMTIADAWRCFGHDNGAASLAEMLRLIAADRPSGAHAEDVIGCTVLTDTFYLPESLWIDVGHRFARNIVSRKQYHEGDPDAVWIWREVQTARALAGVRTASAIAEGFGDDLPTVGEAVPVKQRLHQGAFRVVTLENWNGRCAITGETTRPVLEAAHIQPVSADGLHRQDNGLLMRADMHRLFDRGLIGVKPDYTITVSESIRAQYHNGVAYDAHRGASLKSLPADPAARPNRELLDWHQREVFVP